MAYVEVPASWIEVGLPTKKELFERFRLNQIEHESRLTTQEAATNQSQVLPFGVHGPAHLIGVRNGLGDTVRLPANWTLLAGRIVQGDSTGMTGTMQMDLKYKRGANPFISVFLTPPSVTAANGSYFVSTNGVLLETSLLAGDILRLDILTAPSASAEWSSWVLNLEYEVA
jgi:hypothetical protein